MQRGSLQSRLHTAHIPFSTQRVTCKECNILKYIRFYYLNKRRSWEVNSWSLEKWCNSDKNKNMSQLAGGQRKWMDHFQHDLCLHIIPSLFSACLLCTLSDNKNNYRIFKIPSINRIFLSDKKRLSSSIKHLKWLNEIKSLCFIHRYRFWLPGFQ